MLKIIDNFVEQDALEIAISKYPSLQNLDITIEKGDTNKVIKKNTKVNIYATEKVYVFRMLSFSINQQNDLNIEEKPISNKLTFFNDCSRNAVVNFEYFKKLVLTLALLGYNNLSLYTEDTFEVDNEPYFGYMRGRYSKNEIKEMVKYANKFGITLVPSIATLAHLNNIFFWPEYEGILDTSNTIMIGEERTYILFENIFKTLSEVFESREVHIGFDEAHYVCLGRYFDKHGYVDREEKVFEHLRKIIDIAKKYGFKCAMWSDMFFQLEYGKYHITEEEKTFSKKIKDLVPPDVELVYWDYYRNTQAPYDNMFKRHFELSKNISFAGGAWNWLGFSPLNKRALIHSKCGLLSAELNNIEKIYLTSWGDNGNECARGAIMPSLVQYAEFYNSKSIDENKISIRIKQLTSLTLDDFLSLDILNEYKDNIGCQKMLANPAKFVIYNDPMCGVFDFDLSKGHEEYFKECYEKLKVLAAKESEYQYIFKTIEALATLMVDKVMIGNYLHYAYKKNDREYLKKAKDEVLPRILSKTIEFEKLLRKQWYIENKTIGLDVTQLRIGGQKNRIIETINRLEEYLNGEIDRIEELEIEKLTQKYSWEDDLVYKHNYSRMPLANTDIT